MIGLDKINSQKLKNAIAKIIEAEEYARKTAPEHKLENAQAEEVRKLLSAASSELEELLAELGVKIERKIKKAPDLMELTADSLIVMSRGSDRRRMVGFGVPPQNVIATKGPLKVGDMQVLKPNISENALSKIKKKTKSVQNEIKQKVVDLNIQKLIALAEKGNKADELLAQRVAELAEKLDISSHTITIQRLSDLTASQFSLLLEE